jgi:alpha-tubulin suppressor-like RCC1 family protein
VGITDAGAEIRFFIDLPGLAPATTYYYRVHARNAAGADSSQVQSFVSPDTAPPPPTALTAVPTGESNYLSWQASGARATSYRIERSTDGSPTWSTLATVGTDSLRYVNGWDGTGTHDYSYRVLACRQVGCSQPTDTAQAPLDALVRATAVTAGRQHSCALQPISEELLCWGDNDRGQVNSEVQGPAESPVHVQIGTKYRQISAGYDRTCAIAEDARTYCWGAWNDEQEFDASRQPVPGGIAFQTISVGPDHACGLTAAGAAYCWGANHSYQLAQPDSTFETTTPVLVPGGLTFRTISAGTDHTCGVTTANQAYCWGWNERGQLGIDDSDAIHVYSATPFAVAGGHSFASVSAGDQHTCGVTTTSQAYCWGDNGGGQLGTDSEGSEFAPAPVAGGLAFSSISAGSGITCGLTTSGQAYCWGINEAGALGTGTNASSFSPAPVAGGHTFSSVTTGFGHSCGIATDRQLYCWGWNGYFQIGDGTNTSRNAPVNARFSVPIYLPGN